MPSRRPFERRVRRALILFSLVPTLLLLGAGAFAVARAFAVSDPASAWERVGNSGSELIRRAEASGDPELARAARVHRDELSSSVTHARRWEYLLRRAVIVVPIAALLMAALSVVLAARASRRIGRRLSRPVGELAGWAGLVARGEPLPEPRPGEADEAEFGMLRQAFRSMEEELTTSRARELEAERMRTWIGMARRVAHELKNPLTPMRLAVRTLHRAGTDSEPGREALEVIEQESERLEELARAFAQLGRLPEGPKAEVDLREMLEYLLRSHLPPGVKARLRVPMGLPTVDGYPDALSRAFANLLLNAADATDGSGSVEVVARAVNGYVEVRVLDSGSGIAAEHLERIWEPDFTTKSRGTGLGLTLVRQTVQAHGGKVGARNRPEGGAEFRVVLPVAAEPVSAAGNIG
ncbi:MAG TPA: HAMP domain-containing sensor histidine kinase [Longimicrobium sp.]|nr:HAMP domain-containing sensor histidine kinase [Longimicrobium sp.]